MKRLVPALVLLVAVACSTAPADRTGIIAGVASDTTGAGLPGVTVLVDGNPAGVTDATGTFRLEVPAGSHEVRFDLAGFSPSTHRIRVGAEEERRLAPVLSLATEAAMITVSGEAPHLADAHKAASAPMVVQRGIAAGVEGGVAGGVAGGVVGGVVGGVPGGVTGGIAYRVQSPSYPKEENRESYAEIRENGFIGTSEEHTSTFSIDVDRASYSNVRRFLRSGGLPPRDAVRIEELVNYFPYEYPDARSDEAFSITTEVAAAPWSRDHRLLRIGIQGRKIAPWEAKPNNLVFLIDVSGSMMSSDKLPFVKGALRLLVEELRGDDTVAIVVYAGAAGLVLAPTAGDARAEILEAIDALEAGGSTAGGAGIRLAYSVAREQFDPRANNRVILATDGDFNVGVSSEAELERLIESEREHGIFLTVLGFGPGNYQDSKMELLADKGNGNYAYIDTMLEAKKTLVEEIGGTLVTIAKDVKIQVEFNPAIVESYRLIGYENRLLDNEDFEDDTKDAGELGSGHSVTALYELVTRRPGPVGEVRLRYKEPQGSRSRLVEAAIRDDQRGFEQASPDFRFAAAVAEFGMLLRSSDHRGRSNWRDVEAIVRSVRGADPGGYRGEFLELVELASSGRLTAGELRD